MQITVEYWQIAGLVAGVACLAVGFFMGKKHGHRNKSKAQNGDCQHS